MTDTNLPTGSTEPNQDKPRMKVCPDCLGDMPQMSECCGAAIDADLLICHDCKDHSSIATCETCGGEGEIEMTPEEIRDEIEAKKEQRHTHQL